MVRLLALGVVLCTAMLLPSPVGAKDCRKGKKPCGGKCISVKKECKEDSASGDAAKAPEAAAGPTCKKGKKPCGDQCIPAKKTCKEPGAAGAAAPLVGAKEPTVAASAALASPAGQAMLQLARSLKTSGALDVEDKQRDGFRQSLRAAKAPLPICESSQYQLVKDCEPLVSTNITLPCALAAEEMASFCKERLNQPMRRY